MAKTKKQPKPTMSQYSYMVTGLLTATIQRGIPVTDEVIKTSVEIAKKAYDLIGELMTEQDTYNDGEPTA
jgi:hypothetical protein